MPTSVLYADVSNCGNILNITITDSHIASTSNAVIQCLDTTLTVGDSISIDLGYVGNHSTLFTGYVKSKERKQPDGQWTITCDNVLIRAVEFFIASTNPEEPFSRSNVLAEDLVEDVLELAGLTDYESTPTSFTFGINSPVEVNLVAAYDFCKMVADILSWHIYADNDGTVYFVNRKPYVMTGDSGQPGDEEDESFKTVTGKLTITSNVSEKDLRNRIVVYGRNPIHAEAQEDESYNPLTDDYEQVLPPGFNKTAVVASEWIDTTEIAQTAADYNLDLLNRLTVQGSVGIVGDPDLTARKVVTVVDTVTGMEGLWYIFSCEHKWGPEGYTTNLGLRK